MASISVIIPVYNVSSYIERTIDSVVNQTFKDIEIIVVDDGSTDDSLAIVQKFVRQDMRLIVKSTPNQGVVNARKLGLSTASSPYIFYLDGDDFLEAEALELLYKKAKEEEADMVFLDYQLYNEKIKKTIAVSSLNWNRLLPADWLSRSFLGEIDWAVWTHLHKRSLYESIDVSLLEGLSIGEDAVLTSQLVYASKNVYKVNEVLINYVIREESITKINTLSDQSYQSYVLFPQRIDQYFQNTNDYALLEKGILNIYIRAASETLYKKRYEKAHLMCKKARVGLKKYPELQNGISRRMLKLIKLFAFSQFVGVYYMRECIRKKKI